MQQNNLQSYLSSEFYEKFDLFKAHRFKNLLGLDYKNQVIQILGTNGKGSTGRYLALMLANTGFKVGHFSSPHIFCLSERFCIYDKCDTQSDIKVILEKSHEILQEKLKKINTEEKLSYFEYLCFLATIVFEDCDYVILEAGVGGEYDATSIFKRDLCIFTPISIDHCDLLGSDIDSIFRTKIKAMQDVNIFADKNEMIQKVAIQKGVKAVFLNGNYAKLCLDEAYFLKHNFSLAQLGYFELIEHFYVEKPIKLDLRARCERLAKNIIIDVGHNEAAAINLKLEILRQFDSKVILIANFFDNKEVKKILEILQDTIKEVQILDYKSDRKLCNLEQICNDLGIKNTHFKFLDKNENYAVFGSFLLVEKFLKSFYASKIL